jgi:glutamate synthase (NADPH) small chain
MLEGVKEGVKFMFLVDPKSYEGINGHVNIVKLSVMKLGKPDESGRRFPQPIPNKEVDINCSSVILSIGRGPN